MSLQETPHPVWVDREVIDRAVNITETLVNLNFLVCGETDDLKTIRSYAHQSEERLQALGQLLRSIPITP